MAFVNIGISYVHIALYDPPHTVCLVGRNTQYWSPTTSIFESGLLGLPYIFIYGRNFLVVYMTSQIYVIFDQCSLGSMCITHISMNSEISLSPTNILHPFSQEHPSHSPGPCAEPNDMRASRQLCQYAVAEPGLGPVLQ